MNPNFLNNMSWEMAEVYGAITDQILINLSRYFPFYDAGDPLPESAFKYQAKMLAQLGQVNKDTIQIIRNGLDDADQALKNSLEQAIIDAVRGSEPELIEAVRKGVLTPAGIPVVSPNQTRAFQLYYQQSADKLNLVNTVMLESTKSAYQQTVTDVVSEIELAERLNATQQALDIAAGETITGVSSWNQAIRHATDRMRDRGITGFIDHAGRQWSAEAYTAMDIRTTMFNTARSAVWETNQDFGNDLYLVSYHNGARPLCYPYQNKVISSTDSARTVYDLDGNPIEVIAQSATSYGQAAGLFGINCKHYPTPFIPGVSVADGKPQSKEENDKAYAESQEQRRLERKLREEKRDLLSAKAQGAPQEEIDKLQAKCRQSSQDIDDFCQSTGRARHRDREAVYTKREFPDKEKYDVTAFENKQKEVINQYFSGGGSQQGRTFTGLTPNEPIMPAMPPIAPTPPIAPNPQVMTYGEPFENKGYSKAVQKKFEDAKQALNNAPENARNAWSKAADKMKAPTFGGSRDDASYSHLYNRTKFGTYKKCFDESDYQRKNTVFFHEYGHNIDYIFGKDKRQLYMGDFEPLSVHYNDGAFKKMLMKECEETVSAWYAQSGMTEPITDKAVGKAFAKYVTDKYNIYQRGDISDMFEEYLTGVYGRDLQYPFGVGHGYNYFHTRQNSLPKEAFAEMFSATVTGNDSLGVIKEVFPKSYEIFNEMLGSVLQ